MSYIDDLRNIKLHGKKKEEKKKHWLSPVSEKRKTENELYKIAREEYLAAHKFCECGCGRKAGEIHHKKGKNGKLLYDKKYFMAVARFPCHRKITDEPIWAGEKGFIISRHKKQTA